MDSSDRIPAHRNYPFESCRQCIGIQVRDPSGDVVAAVEDLVIDAREGRIAYVHLVLAGERRRLVIPWSALVIDPGSAGGWRVIAHKATLDRVSGNRT